MNEARVTTSAMVEAGIFPTKIKLESRKKAARRFAKRLSNKHPGQVVKTPNGYHISELARLPSGQTVQSFLRCGSGPPTLAGHRLPPGHENRREKDNERSINTWLLLDRWDEFRAAHSAMSQDVCICMFRAQHGAWAKSVGLKCHLKRLQEYRRRVDPNSDCFDGNVDGRGRPRGGGTEPSPEAWELFKSIYLHRNKHSLAAAWRFVRGEAKKQGWTWPSLSTIRQKVRREIPRPVVTLLRRGNRVFEAEALPKIRRDYDRIAAMDWWSLDCKILDFWARIRDSRGCWKRVRLVLSLIIDMRSRAIVGWSIGVTENADMIIASVEMGLLNCGIPANIHADNGKAYKKALSNSRKLDDLDQRFKSIFGVLKTTIHLAIPFHAWSKLVENVNGLIKNNYDRWSRSFCGGSPSERPEGSDKYARTHVTELPTIDEVRKSFNVFVEGYNSTPMDVPGLNGISPKQAMDTYRVEDRRADAKLIRHLCATFYPATVGNNGVTWNGLLYGQKSVRLFQLQGQKVFLRIDPLDASSVVVCDLGKRPLLRATNRCLGGTSQEDVREAARVRSRMRRAARAYGAPSRTLIESPIETVMKLKYEHARAAEAEASKMLPTPVVPKVVTVVRPELSEALAQIEAAEPEQAPEPIERKLQLEDLYDLIQIDKPAQPSMTFDEWADLCDDESCGQEIKRPSDGDGHFPDWWQRVPKNSKDKIA